MRTLRADGTAMTAALNQAANADSRKPVARLTLRDTLLRFSQTPVTVTNPWSVMTTSTQVGGEDIRPGCALALSDGSLARAWCSTLGGQTAVLRTNHVTDPTVAAQWNNWVSTGITCDANCNPSLRMLGADLYLFYTQGGQIKYTLTQTIGSGTFMSTWLAATGTGITLTGGVITLRVTRMVAGDWNVFASVVVGKAIRVYLLHAASGVWTKFERPWYQDGNRKQAISTSALDSTQFFDAFELGGRTFYIYSWAPTGECWIGEYANGTWGNPRELLPNDYGHFHPYYATVIQNQVWLTGRVERDNTSTTETLTRWSPSWDAYLYSADGVNWTALARESFITDVKVRGQLLLPSAGYGTLYYAGMAKVYSAPATWLVDPAGDKSSLQVVLGNTHEGNWNDHASFDGQTVYDDIVSAQANFPASGTAPEMVVEVANGDESWYHAPKLALLKPDAELTLDLGYQTGASLEEYVTIFQGSLDTFAQGNATGARTLQLSTRDSLYKRLQDGYTGLFWWAFMSQVKSFSNCDVMDNLVALSGTWAAVSKNKLANPSFEGSHDATSFLPSGWVEVGSGTGTAKASQAVTAQDGNWSCEIIKTDNDASKTLGIQQLVALTAGQSYDLSMLVNPVVLTGGGQELTLRVLRSDTSALVASNVQNNPLSDPGSGNDWVSFTTTFTAPYSGNHTIQFYYSNCQLGTVYIDTCNLSNTDKQISNSDLDVDGVCYSTELTQVTDFDIRGRFYLDATDSSQVADVVGMGLVGCLVDKSNFILLQLQKNSSTYNVGFFSKRSGVYKSLATAYAFAWAVNTQYDLRLIHRQGHFWCYVKAATDTTWTGPLFTTGSYDHYVWDPNANGPVIYSDDGFATVGIRAYRHSKGFIAMGADVNARVIPFQSDLAAGIWDAFPTSGEILWNNTERCTFTRKTAKALGDGAWGIYRPSTNNWGGMDVRYPLDGTYTRFAGWHPVDWWWRCDLHLVGPLNFGVTAYDGGVQNAPILANTQAGYALSFGPGQPEAPYAAWEILMSRNMVANGESADYPNGIVDDHVGTRLSGTGGIPVAGGSADPNATWIAWAGTVANLRSGYETVFPHKSTVPYTPNGGPGGNIGFAQASMDIRLAPCLANVTRGANGTVAMAHADGEQAMLYTSDVIRLVQFEAHDLATDFNTETLIQRACALAGILKTSFGDTYTNAAPGVLPGNGVILLVPGSSAHLQRRDFEVSFDFTGGATESGFVVRYHLASSGVNAWKSGRTLEIYQTIGANWTARLSHSPDNGVTQVIDEQLSLVQPYNLNVSDHCRVVINGAWTTIYINGATAACFHTDQDTDTNTELMLDTYAPLATDHPYTNVRIPELDEWRDALRFDVNQTVQDFLSLVIEDRPIFYISRSGQSLYFSTFNTRAKLTTADDGVSAGSFEYRILDDQLQITDNNRYSYTRVEAVDILEMLNVTLASANGFVMKMLHMNKATNTQADAMATRALTLMQEGLSVIADQLAANLRFEPEDAFDTTYTDPATSLKNQGRSDPVNGPVVHDGPTGNDNGPARALIVNDLTFTYDDQGLIMQVGARQRQS